ncbi:XPG N-terminal domain-containing protein [Toxoplasma gondii VEG]|uniref:RAD2 endonuclease, putative n=3 Tax=Toxoplasma gondii TaxID=5811 RepID=B9Q568_TOXGV|nr:XPG N-terminal domain-containing protein [Toxoplasma gondii VEG]KFG52494.1 XPG N-terminal domain-containing protein [Toxoplasma gondii p89]PUA87688.1 XPG N-terminal domain-containing protein [Toxoplasma gondii TgCATBr9]CEL75485.1 TPA: RAD2 endonuclease, putative [Toxoplasma gondii VEG]
MGVKGLWDLLEPAGRRVAAGNLKGKVVAVDAAIWLVQFLHAMKLPDGSPMPAAHLVGFFNRLCRLLFFEIRPIIVFDGPPPFLKRQTLLTRKRQRQQQEKNLRSVVARLLLNRLKEQRRQEQAGASGTQEKAFEVPVPQDLVSVPDTSSASSLVPSKSPTPPPAALPSGSLVSVSSSSPDRSSGVASPSPCAPGAGRSGDVDEAADDPASRLFSADEEDSEAEEERGARGCDTENVDQRKRRCVNRRRRSCADSDLSEVTPEGEAASDDGVSVEAETRGRSLAPPVPEELRGFLSSRRQLGELPMPSVLAMPASAASTKAFENLGLPSLIKRGHDGESRKVVRRAEDFKAYRLEDDSFVQLPLDAEIDQEVFDLLPPMVQFQILTQLRDAWLQDSRVKALQAKNNIFVFSNVQLESYIRSVQANQHLTTVKMRLAAAQHHEGDTSRSDADIAVSRCTSSSSSSSSSSGTETTCLALPASPHAADRRCGFDVLKAERVSPTTSPASARSRCPEFSSRVLPRPLPLFSGGREVAARGPGGPALAAEWTSLSGALLGAEDTSKAQGRSSTAGFADRAFSLDGGLKLSRQKGFMNDLTRTVLPLAAPREAALLTPSELLAAATQAARHGGAGLLGGSQRGEGSGLWAKLKEEEEGRRRKIKESRMTGRWLKEDEKDEEDDAVIVTGSGEKQHIALLDDREIFGDAFFDSTVENQTSIASANRSGATTERLHSQEVAAISLLDEAEEAGNVCPAQKAPTLVVRDKETVVVDDETGDTEQVPKLPQGVMTLDEDSDEFDNCIVDTSEEADSESQVCSASLSTSLVPAAVPAVPRAERSGYSIGSLPCGARPSHAAGPATSSSPPQGDSNKATEEGEGGSDACKEQQSGEAGSEAEVAAQTRGQRVRPRLVRRRGFGRRRVCASLASSLDSGQVTEETKTADASQSHLSSASSSSSTVSSSRPPSAFASCTPSSCFSSRTSGSVSVEPKEGIRDTSHFQGSPGACAEEGNFLRKGKAKGGAPFEAHPRGPQDKASCDSTEERDSVNCGSKSTSNPFGSDLMDTVFCESSTSKNSEEFKMNPLIADANWTRVAAPTGQSEKSEEAEAFSFSSSHPTRELEAATGSGHAETRSERKTNGQEDEKKAAGKDEAVEDIVDKLLAELGTVSFPQEAMHRPLWGEKEGQASGSEDEEVGEKDTSERRRKRLHNQDEEEEFMQLWLAVFPQLKEHLPADQSGDQDTAKAAQSRNLGTLPDEESPDEIGDESDDVVATTEAKDMEAERQHVWDDLFFDTEGVPPDKSEEGKLQEKEPPSSVERERRAAEERETRAVLHPEGQSKKVEEATKRPTKRRGIVGATQGLQPRLPSSAIFPAVPEATDEPSTPTASRASQAALMTMGGSSADEQLREKLEEEKLLLLQQAGMLQQQTGNITERMKDQVIALLRAFGVPFITAPGEAEATAAYLTKQNLADAVISDDSDALVFGAREIYRNFFENKKSVEMYEASFIAHKLGLGQQQLILLAMLLGCDYTLGVKGIGIVNAVEVLRAYPSLESLRAFRAWAEAPWTLGITASDSAEVRKYKEEHKNYRLQWIFPHDFPSPEVFDAFESPLVDRSREPFSWAVPDVDSIVAIMTHAGGLRRSEVLDCLLPAVQRYTSAHAFQRQTRITAFLPFVERNAKKAGSFRGTNQEGRTDENPVYDALAKAAQAAEADVKKNKKGRKRNGDFKGGRGDEVRFSNTQENEGDDSEEDEERGTHLQSVAACEEREERRTRQEQAIPDAAAEVQRLEDEGAVAVIRSKRMLRAVSVLGQRHRKGQDTAAVSHLPEGEVEKKETSLQDEDDCKTKRRGGRRQPGAARDGRAKSRSQRSPQGSSHVQSNKEANMPQGNAEGEKRSAARQPHRNRRRQAGPIERRPDAATRLTVGSPVDGKREKERNSGEAQIGDSFRDTASGDSDHDGLVESDKKRMRHRSPPYADQSDLRDEDAVLVATMMQELDAEEDLESLAAAAEAELENDL